MEVGYNRGCSIGERSPKQLALGFSVAGLVVWYGWPWEPNLVGFRARPGWPQELGLRAQLGQLVERDEVGPGLVTRPLKSCRTDQELGFNDFFLLNLACSHLVLPSKQRLRYGKLSYNQLFCLPFRMWDGNSDRGMGANDEY